MLWTRGGSEEEKLRMTKLEHIVNQRDIFLNSCLIRQDKNSVNQWVKRMALVKDKIETLEETFEMALTQIDVFKTNQGLVELFVAYANEFFVRKDFKRCDLLLLEIYYK